MLRFKLIPFLALSILSAPVSTPKSYAQNLLPNYIFDISAVRSAHSDNEFAIRLASQTTMTGCYDVTEPTIKKVDAGAVVYVTLDGGDITPAKKPSYGLSSCTMQSGAPFTDIPFDAETLRENSTYKIEIKSKAAGKLYDIQLKHGAEKLTLETELKTPVNIPRHEKEKTLYLWDYPQKTVVLSANGIDKNMNRLKELKSFASSNGLIPLHEILESFPQPRPNSKELFYVDTKDMLQDALQNASLGKSISIGFIEDSTNQTIPNNPFEQDSRINIFARQLTIHD